MAVTGNQRAKNRPKVNLGSGSRLPACMSLRQAVLDQIAKRDPLVIE